MSSSAATLSRLQQRALEADEIIEKLKSQLQQVRQAAVAKACIAEQERLSAENAQLRREVDKLRNELIAAETKHGVKQLPVHGTKGCQQVTSTPVPKTQVLQPAAKNFAPSVAEPVAAKSKDAQKVQKAEKKPSEPKPAATASDAPGSTGGEQVDVSRLNMHIGRIVNVKKHPDADSLYVEEVDVGEVQHRTIVSGLVKHVPLEQMQDRIAVFLLNLKPAKMRGVMSEGMIMCASSPEKVEIIVPPPGVAVGDRVTVQGYPGNPDEQLNPKKKTWEQIQPDLRINSEGVATYKGAPWMVEGKEGLFKAPTAVNSAIK